MRKHIAYLLSALLVGASPIVLAHGGGGGVSHGGGMSAGHISTEGLANTNGPNAVDRDKGLERAEDRMNEEGLEHQQADKQDLNPDGVDADQDTHKGHHKGAGR